MEPITKDDADAVLAAVRAQYPSAMANEFTLVADFDGRQWTILGEMGPEEWPFNFPYGDDALSVPDVWERIPGHVWTEPVNHYSIAIYRR